MTYTMEKSLANFLSKEEGILSKSFIDTLTLFYGQTAGRLAFISTLQACSNLNIRLGVYAVIPEERDGGLAHTQRRMRDWFPGRAYKINTINGFDIYRCERYSTTIDVWNGGRSLLGILRDKFESDGISHGSQAAYQTLLWDTLYDKVSAQDYTVPADDAAVEEQVTSILSSSPNFRTERWHNIQFEFDSFRTC